VAVQLALGLVMKSALEALYARCTIQIDAFIRVMCCIVLSRLVVRILPPVNDKCIVPLGMKFGCHPKQVPHLLKVAKELDLDVVGVRSDAKTAIHVLCCYVLVFAALSGVAGLFRGLKATF